MWAETAWSEDTSGAQLRGTGATALSDNDGGPAYRSKASLLAQPLRNPSEMTLTSPQPAGQGERLQDPTLEPDTRAEGGTLPSARVGLPFQIWSRVQRSKPLTSGSCHQGSFSHRRNRDHALHRLHRPVLRDVSRWVKEPHSTLRING